MERTGGVTSKGKPMTVVGKPLAMGDALPDVTLVATDWAAVKLNDFAGKVRLVSVAPSIDTGICDVQTRRYAKYVLEIAQHPNYDAALTAVKQLL